MPIVRTPACRDNGSHVESVCWILAAVHHGPRVHVSPRYRRGPVHVRVRVRVDVILYVLLKPVNRHAALLMLGFNPPRLASILFPSILVPAFIGELSFAVWLTVKGVNAARWWEMAERATG